MSEKTVIIKYKPFGSEGENKRTIQPFNPTESEFTICNPQIYKYKVNNSDFKVRYEIVFEAQGELTFPQLNAALNAITS